MITGAGAGVNPPGEKCALAILCVDCTTVSATMLALV